MSITNELRECATNWGRDLIGRGGKAVLFNIADRIDAEHEAQLKDAFETRNSDENQENDGWVRGPLDADGVMWHEGDMSDSWGEIERIMRAVDGSWYVKGHDVSAPWVRADSMRHQKQPTVDEILDELEGMRGNYADFDDVVERSAFLAGMLRELLCGDAE